MFKKITVCATLILLCCMSHAVDVKVQGSEISHSLIYEAKLRDRVEFLADSVCGGRAMGSKGSMEAVFWLQRHFKKLGLKPMGNCYVRHFKTGDGTIGRNVIAYQSGSRRAPKERYIVMVSHFDGLGVINGKIYPGADSDVSGVVAMMGVAEMLASMIRYGKAYPRNIIYVALDGKHTGMSGVRALWKMIEDGDLVNPDNGERVTAEKVSLMVNIDQIGCSLSPLRSGRPDYIILLSGDNTYFPAALSAANRQYGIGLELAKDYYGSENFTDIFYRRASEQRFFLENGKQAAMFTSGITMNNNKVTDTAESLDYTVMKKRIWLIFHWLEKVM